jgi:hypothetical protein
MMPNAVIVKLGMSSTMIKLINPTLALSAKIAFTVKN